MKKAVVLPAVAITVSALLCSVPFAEAPLLQKTPEQAINGYFNAEKAGNVDLMIQYSQDDSYDDEDARAFAYRDSLQANPLVSYEIVSKTKVDDTHIDYLVQQKFKQNTDPLPPLTYTAFEENGKWRVLVKPYVVDRVKGSPDYGKVTVRKTKEQKPVYPDSNKVSTTTSVVYYNIGTLAPGKSFTGDSSHTFAMNRYDGQLTLNGWQDSGGFPDLDYNVVTLSGTTMTKYASLNIFNIYPQSGSWYTYYEQGIPYNPTSVYRMNIVNLNSNYSDTGAGNGYE